MLGAVLLLITVSSCKKEEETPAHFGKWNAAVLNYKLYDSGVLVFDTTVNYDEDYTEVINFKDDKNISFTHTDNIENETWTDDATYEINGTKLFITYEGGEIDTLDYFKVDGSKLYIEDAYESKTDPDREEYRITYNKID